MKRHFRIAENVTLLASPGYLVWVHREHTLGGEQIEIYLVIDTQGNFQEIE